jgi:hypothetical protein
MTGVWEYPRRGDWPIGFICPKVGGFSEVD